MHDSVSDGCLALIRAVDGFDFARGNRFSTYATRAIRNKLTENASRFILRRGHPFAIYEESLAAPDPGVDEHELEELQNHRRSMVRRWLGQLGELERRVLESRYGIGGAPQQTLAKIGQELGVSKERVRKIVVRAQAKLRKFARLEGLEPPEI